MPAARSGDTLRERREGERPASADAQRPSPRRPRDARAPPTAPPASSRPAPERATAGDAEAPDPRVGESRDVLLLDDEMPGEREAVQLRLGQATAEIGGELEVEDGIALAPRKEDRRVDLGQAGGNPGERSVGRVSGGRGDVRDEVGDRTPIVGCAVRREVAGANRTRDPPVPREQGAANERGGLATADIAQHSRAGETNRQRHARRRHRDARVAEDDPAHPLLVLDGPPECDRTAPVVGGEDDGAVDAESFDDPPEIVDPLGVAPRARPLGEAHRDLVDRDDAVAVTEAAMKRAPEHRPRGVSVHADDRQRRLHAVGRVGRRERGRRPRCRRRA